jgi:hypothetical protein
LVTPEKSTAPAGCTSAPWQRGSLTEANVTAIFVKPLVPHGPKDGNWPNRPVNISMCSYIVKTIYETPLKIRLPKDGKIPQLKFVGCDMSWWFSSEEERDREYDRLMERFAA